jgi:succinoglycan biosynthesis protein ExoA
MNASLPFVSIIIPVKPGLNPDAADALKKTDYPKENLEIFVVYGRNPSYQRNVAAEKACGDIIYFLDNDSIPAPDTLLKLTNHINCDVVLAGGPSLMPSGAQFLPYIFGMTLESYLCMGTSANRYKKSGIARYSTEKEIILCNMVMKRDSFLELGGLNERLYPNEENHLMERVRHAGKKMVYDPNAHVTRMPRKTLQAFIRQVFSYGRGRGEQTIYYPRSFSLLNFAPLVFLIYIVSSLFIKATPLFPVFFYFLILFIDAAIKIVTKKDLRLIFLPISSFLLHLTYGAGTIYGILKAPFKEILRGEVKVEKINL